MEGQQAVNDLVVFNDGRRMNTLLSNYMGMNVTVAENPADGTFSLLVNGIPHPDPALSNMSAAALEDSARSFFDVQYRTTMAQRAALQAEAYAEAFGTEAGKLEAAKLAAAQAGVTGRWTLEGTSSTDLGPQYFIKIGNDIRILKPEEDRTTGEINYVITAVTEEDLGTALLGGQ